MMKFYNLEFILILSPPRSCSTLLERILLESEAVAGQINEPWAQLPFTENESNRETYAYNYILSRLEKIVYEKQENQFLIIIKDISYLILPGEVFSRYALLFKKIILLIRNPLLSAISLCRTLISTAKYYKDATYLNGHGKILGYETWDMLEKEALNKNDFRLCPFIFEEYIENVEPSTKQNQSNIVKKLNSNSAIAWILGWLSIEKQFNQAIFLEKNVFIIDATYFRLSPSYCMMKLSQFLEVKFVNPFLNLSENSSLRFKKGYEKVDGVTPFFDKALFSLKIFPPFEKTITPLKLPVNLENYLTNKDNPYITYLNLLRLSTRHFNSNQKKHSVFPMRKLKKIDPLFLYCIKRISSKGHAEKVLCKLKHLLRKNLKRKVK